MSGCFFLKHGVKYDEYTLLFSLQQLPQPTWWTDADGNI